MLQIYNLPKKERILAMQEYVEGEYSKGSAYACWFFGFYRVYTKQYHLFFLFILTVLLGVGVIRWIADLFFVSSYVKKANSKLDNDLLMKYEK